MNALGQQMALARGASAPGQRLALAQACDVAACDGASSPFSVWASVLGGLGSCWATAMPATFTYNFGGAAAGIDYRIDPRFLVGLAAGYTHGTQWVNGFLGQGWSDSVSVAAYGGSPHGLLPRCAGGLCLLRQPAAAADRDPRPAAEDGQRQHRGQPVPRPGRSRLQGRLYAPAAATVTPFGRLQVSSVTQNAFTESGAGRSASTWRRRQRTRCAPRWAPTSPARSARRRAHARSRASAGLAARVRRHRPADHGGLRRRAGQLFTVYGATPQRNSAVIGFSASTAIAAGHADLPALRRRDRRGTDNHALNLGVRLSW